MKKIIIFRREDYGVGSATGRFLISELKKKGIHRVRPLEGGLDAWRERKYPVERRPLPPLASP